MGGVTPPCSVLTRRTCTPLLRLIARLTCSLVLHPVATRAGFEPATSSLSRWRSNRLN